MKRLIALVAGIVIMLLSVPTATVAAGASEPVMKWGPLTHVKAGTNNACPRGTDKFIKVRATIEAPATLSNFKKFKIVLRDGTVRKAAPYSMGDRQVVYFIKVGRTAKIARNLNKSGTTYTTTYLTKWTADASKKCLNIR